MERKVQFRDYQEQTASDHNNIQAYTRESFDRIVKDVVTAGRRFSGLNAAKTGQVEVTVAPGAVYVEGAVHERRTALTQSMATYTAAAAKRIVTLSAFGQEVETDNQQRDFLVNTDTGEVEPRAVSMTASREVNLVFTAGSEAADPVPPAIPATHVVVAQILLDTTQVVSITMVTDNEVESTDALDQRAKLLEQFRAAIEPRVNSLASDLASLANQVAGRSAKQDLSRVFLDLARLKEALRFPDTASDYGADWFLGRDESDHTNAATLGYDAKVEEGIRFADANADQFEITLFSANDPNASFSNGVLLPRYTEELKLNTDRGDAYSFLGIAQYGFQTHEMKQGYMSRSRLRYGGSETVCSNGSQWNAPGQPVDATGLYDFESSGFTAIGDQYTDFALGWWVHEVTRKDTYWLDTWKEPFMYAVTVDHTISGAQVAQTFLISNDIWSTRLGFYIGAKGANEDIHIALTEVTNGVPDLNKTVMKTVYPHASIVAGWNTLAIPPTFLKKGKRYAFVFISNANHTVGMTNGQTYLDGTFFYSTDGQYFQGDLTKDMMILVYGAKFNSSQVTIEFAPINLDGGLRDIDILAEQWAPESTQLIFEIRPNGSGEWFPLGPDNGTILNGAPALAQFRARFVGTKDMAPAIKLVGSRVKVSRPKTAFKHVSTKQTLGAPSSTIHLKYVLERFDDTPHDFTANLRVGVAKTLETPDTVTTKLLDAEAGRYEREFTFNLAAPQTEFFIVSEGSTNSPSNVWHVAERTHYSI